LSTTNYHTMYEDIKDVLFTYGKISENKVELIWIKHQLIQRYQVCSGKEEYNCMLFSDLNAAIDVYLKIVKKRNKNIDTPKISRKKDKYHN